MSPGRIKEVSEGLERECVREWQCKCRPCSDDRIDESGRSVFKASSHSHSSIAVPGLMYTCVTD